MKKIILSIAAGFMTLSLGLAIFYAGEFLVSIFQTREVEKVELIPKELVETKQITIEELFNPKPVILNEEIEETEAQTENENVETYVETYYEGNYYVIGGAPKDFGDCAWLLITTRNYGNASEEIEYETIPPTGFIYADHDEPPLSFTSLGIANKNITFETEVRSKISYRFVGKFIEREQVKSGEHTDFAHLKGKFTKIKNGKKIAEQDVIFGLNEKCWH